MKTVRAGSCESLASCKRTAREGAISIADVTLSFRFCRSLVSSVLGPVALKIQDLPIRERPRERLLSLGVSALSDRELIALVLRNGRRGESALDVAGKLLADFGSLE